MMAMHGWYAMWESSSSLIIDDVLSDPSQLPFINSHGNEEYTGKFYQRIGDGYITLIITVNPRTNNIVNGFPTAGDYTTKEFFNQTKSQMPFWLEELGYTYN